MKKNVVESNFNKLGAKKLLLLNQILLTIVGISFFIIWLVFATDNFYARSATNVAGKFMSIPIQAIVWPIAFIALFIFILPFWATKSFKLLFFDLFLCLAIAILTFIFLGFLLVTIPWVIWLLLNLLTFAVLIFAVISFIYLYKNDK